MAKINLDQSELTNHLDEQIQFLINSSESYDAGNQIEAKRLAVTLRVLLHDTKSSKSLLGQLGLKDKTEFFDSKLKNLNEESAGISSYSGLISTTLIDDKTPPYVPNLDGTYFNKVSFDTWWNDPVFTDLKGTSFSRKDIVLTLANQDGGAHVDPALDEKFLELSRNNSLGHSTNSGGKWEPLKTPELAAVRQIAHEALKSLIPGYKKNLELKGDGYLIGGGGIQIIPADETASKRNPKGIKAKIGRNAPCPCGSSKKYKKCCGQLR